MQKKVEINGYYKMCANFRETARTFDLQDSSVRMEVHGKVMLKAQENHHRAPLDEELLRWIIVIND